VYIVYLYKFVSNLATIIGEYMDLALTL